MKDLEEAFTIAYSREGRLQFLVQSSIHLAKSGEAVEEHIRLIHNIPNPDACRARYILELRNEVKYLCEEWGKISDKINYSKKEILDEFRRQLGSDYDPCLGSFWSMPS